MMISPDMYISEHKEDTFEQLIKERNYIVREIKKLEKIVFNKDENDDDWTISPGPDVKYQINLEYLAALCTFMKEKYNTEIVYKKRSILL